MAVIDIDYAWRLVRDASRADWPAGGARLRLGAAGRAALEVDRAGGWRSTVTAAPEAAELLDALLPVTVPDTVVGQLGQSLDGRIATVTGASHYVTGEASRVHLHRLRALVDAVIVGAGTVAADDPQLTVRHVDGHDPVRVVLDPNARLPADRRVFIDGRPPTLHVVARGRAAHAGHGVRALEVETTAAGVAPAVLLEALAARGLRRVLVEGGGLTVSRFLDAGLLTRLHVVVAPMLIGSGRPAVTLPEIATLDHALRPPCRARPMGADLFFDLDLSTSARSP